MLNNPNKCQKVCRWVCGSLEWGFTGCLARILDSKLSDLAAKRAGNNLFLQTIACFGANLSARVQSNPLFPLFEGCAKNPTLNRKSVN